MIWGFEVNAKICFWREEEEEEEKIRKISGHRQMSANLYESVVNFIKKVE